ncbi:BON domain-containing protein [Photobacterium profundum]|uniref:Hypothetical Flp pilus assembly protein n=2 Tax=Photobacterium profundum TaxID=74109 RepID=Q1Z417_9GAMM|nr:hypothetical Flp pilus assembly protein [Photobacterium profundum 3TCK]PSV61421.1 BON domain-containing protein [Photobacterium profundum]
MFNPFRSVLSFNETVISLMLICLSSPVFASDKFVTLNDANNLEFSQEIGTVFVSQPDILDYKVIDSRKLVIFSNKIGQAKVIVYGKDNQVLLSQRYHVDINLSQVRRQLKLYYPDLSISVTSVGEQVAIRGTVNNEKQRDDIYRMVATLLSKKEIERYNEAEKLKFVESGFEEANWVRYSKNYTWEGIIEGLVVAQAQQVNVKISVAQVTKEFNETIGVDWSTVGRSVGEFSFLEFKANDLSTVINAIGNDNIAEILAEPNLTVLSGESASFLVGGEVPVIVTNDNSTNISFKEFGIKLELSAKVLSNKKIKLQLAPEVSAVDGYVKAAGIEVPQLSSRRAMTTIQLADGDSFMLGGLMSSDDIEEISKIPLLGDIPILGAAFRKSSTTRKKTELVIVATVNLVKPVSPTDVRLPHMRKTTTLRRLFNITQNEESAEYQQTNQTHADKLAIQMLSEGGFIQ